MRKAKRKKCFALALAAGSILVGLGIMQALFSLGVFSDDRAADPTWNPAEKWRRIDRELNRKNEERSKENRFGFNDMERCEEKPPGVRRRIAVLGDSIIWGDGLPREKAWSHKLEALLKARSPEIEVLHWGLRGWSTADELAFFKEHGKDFAPDLLIVGFCVNDPDPGDTPVKEIPWRTYLYPAFLLFPDLANALAARANNFLYANYLSDYGYKAWQDRLYLPDNLSRYSALLKELADLCAKGKIPLLFVLTPNNHSEYNREYFDKILPVFAANKIPVLDLYPAVSEKLGGMTYKELCANPANAHPGDPVTTVFADTVFSFLSTRPEYAFLFGEVPSGNRSE